MTYKPSVIRLKKMLNSLNIKSLWGIRIKLAIAASIVIQIKCRYVQRIKEYLYNPNLILKR